MSISEEMVEMASQTYLDAHYGNKPIHPMRAALEAIFPEIIEALRPFAKCTRYGLPSYDDLLRARTVFLKLGGKLDET